MVEIMFHEIRPLDIDRPSGRGFYRPRNLDDDDDSSRPTGRQTGGILLCVPSSGVWVARARLDCFCVPGTAHGTSANSVVEACFEPSSLLLWVCENLSPSTLAPSRSHRSQVRIGGGSSRVLE